MKRLRVYHVMFPAFLLVTVFAISPWSYSSQKHQEQLNNALLYAAMYGDTAAARDLLRSGADPNCCEQPASLRERLEQICPAVRHIYQSDPPPLYETALEIAVQCDKTNVVRVLLAGGADVTQKDNHGQTALDFAYGYPDDGGISDMLREAAKKRKRTEVRGGSR